MEIVDTQKVRVKKIREGRREIGGQVKRDNVGVLAYSSAKHLVSHVFSVSCSKNTYTFKLPQ